MSLNLDELSHLIGYKVRINRGGPDSVEGILTAIGDDYLRIEIKNEVIFVPSTHIKSITSIDKENVPLATNSNFMALLQNLINKKIQINRGGPEKVEGLVKNVTREFLHLEAKKEQIQINITHIKNVTLIKGAANANNSKSKSVKEQIKKTDKNEKKGKTKQDSN